MRISKKKLATYEKHTGVRVEVVDDLSEFNHEREHPVVMVKMSRKEFPEPWRGLYCPCNQQWKIVTRNKKRILVHTDDLHECEVKKRVRQKIRKEIHDARTGFWGSLSLADAILNIFLQSKAGNYFGENQVGILYLQDIAELLCDHPLIGTEDTFFGTKELLSAIDELTKRKLIDLNGAILIPYKEFFRFPARIHHTLAFLFEAPLGWPNGEAGDCFLYDLYRKISKQTGWTKGEDVFGEEHIPECSEEVGKKWLNALDARLLDETLSDERSDIVRELTLDQWIEWLKKIKESVA